MIKKLTFAGITALILFVSTSCSPFATPGQTVLAPTPLSLAYGKIQSLEEFGKLDLSKPVPVFICSSRNIEPHGDRVDPFGNKRSEKLVPYLALAKVSIGKNTSPEEVLRETVSVGAKKRTRVKMESLEMFDSPNLTPFSSLADKKREFIKNKWLKTIALEMNKSERKELTIFVHGYNTNLVENTELLSEMYHYAARQGAVVNYEWPSAGRLVGYFQDKGNAEQSTRMFRSFISRVAQITGAERVRIIAHSAGNPIVVNALKDLRLLNRKLTPRQLQEKFRISQVILAAPDMDSMRFMNAVFDRFFEMSKDVSVYASPNDRALLLSGKLFGTNRLGSAIGKFTDWEKVALKKAENLQLIDVTVPQRKYGSLLGHGYFHRDPWVSSDILLSGVRPNAGDRGLVRSKDSVFWEFTNDYPDKLKNLR
ncbi:MAG: alpha/beta hydrolase [Akkermansiaceae bacterium]